MELNVYGALQIYINWNRCEGKPGTSSYGKKYKNKIKIKVKLNSENDFSEFMKRNPLSDTLNQINPNLRPNPIKLNTGIVK